MNNSITSDIIRLSKEKHRGKDIVLLKFRGRRDWLNKIKKLNELKFSRTKGFWYIPYSKSAYDAFVQMGLPYSLPRTHVEEAPSTGLPDSDHDTTGIDVEANIVTTSFSSGKKNVDIQEASKIDVTWNSSKFSIRMRYDARSVKFIKSLEAAWWNQKSKTWICKGSIRNLEKLQEKWNVWSDEKYDKIYQQIGLATNPCKVSLYYSPKYKDQVCVKLIGFGANHQFLKKISNRRYHKELKIYTVPANHDVIRTIVEYYKSIGYGIDNRLSTFKTKKVELSDSKKLDLFLKKFESGKYTALRKMASIMHRQRYGLNTIKEYCGKLAKLMDYYNTDDPDNITIDQVFAFIDHLQIQGVSFSLVNKVYSALKLYYSHVSPDVEFPIERLKRPRKKFALPSFLSANELLRLLDHVSNIKHLSILYLLYGSGLRRSEVLKLKLEHVYWDRNQLLIKSAKGENDRMVNLSRDAKMLLEGYFHKYMPQVYLFEGAKAGQMYSGSSVAKIGKKSHLTDRKGV